jgi:integrase
LDSIPGAKVNAPEIRVVCPEERSRLMEALPLRVRLVARFLYATAARVTEALEVKLTNLKLDGQRVLLRFHGKGRKERWVRIPKGLLEEIDTTFGWDGREYLFETLEGCPFSRHLVTPSDVRLRECYCRARYEDCEIAQRILADLPVPLGASPGGIHEPI